MFMNEEEKILEELQVEHPIGDMIKFDNLGIQEAIRDNDFHAIRYKELWIKEMSIYEEMESLLDKLMAERYNHYRFEISESLQKVEIEKYYLPGDKKVLQMKKLLRKQKIRVEFFDMCAKAFNQRRWSLKVFSDNLRGGAI